MKVKSLFFLFLFVSLLLTPTTLFLIDKPIDTTFLLSINEEENNKDSQDLISFDELEFLNSLQEFELCNMTIEKGSSKNLNLAVVKIYSETISPPPELF